MPELPDLLLYLHALAPRVVGTRLERVRLFTPFLLRTVEPPIEAAEGQHVVALRRIGKRIVFALEQELFLVVHLMIAGRFQWEDRVVAIGEDGGEAATPRAKAGRPGKPGGKIGLAELVFERGTLRLTEAGTKKRASLHVVLGEEGLRALDPGGIEPLEVDLATFRAALTRENHTVKRV